MSDADGYPLAHVYFEDDEKRRHMMHRLTKDEARRMVVAIERLPDLLKIEKQAKIGADFES